MNTRILTITLALAAASTLNLDAQDLYADSTTVFMDSTAVCTDSLTVEFPESMNFDIDSLMGLWFAKQYLSYDEECMEGSIKIGRAHV